MSFPLEVSVARVCSATLIRLSALLTLMHARPPIDCSEKAGRTLLLFGGFMTRLLLLPLCVAVAGGALATRSTVGRTKAARSAARSSWHNVFTGVCYGATEGRGAVQCRLSLRRQAWQRRGARPMQSVDALQAFDITCSRRGRIRDRRARPLFLNVWAPALHDGKSGRHGVVHGAGFRPGPYRVTPMTTLAPRRRRRRVTVNTPHALAT